MTELAILVIAFLAFSLIVVTVDRVIRQARARVSSPRPWEIEEHALTTPTGAWMQVSVVHPGTNERILVSSVKCDTVDFQERMIDARVWAEDKLLILNAAQKRLDK